MLDDEGFVSSFDISWLCVWLVYGSSFASCFKRKWVMC